MATLWLALFDRAGDGRVWLVSLCHPGAAAPQSSFGIIGDLMIGMIKALKVRLASPSTPSPTCLHPCASASQMGQHVGANGGVTVSSAFYRVSRQHCSMSYTLPPTVRVGTPPPRPARAHGTRASPSPTLARLPLIIHPAYAHVRPLATKLSGLAKTLYADPTINV